MEELKLYYAFKKNKNRAVRCCFFTDHYLQIGETFEWCFHNYIIEDIVDDKEHYDTEKFLIVKEIYSPKENLVNIKSSQEIIRQAMAIIRIQLIGVSSGNIRWHKLMKMHTELLQGLNQNILLGENSFPIKER